MRDLGTCGLSGLVLAILMAVFATTQASGQQRSIQTRTQRILEVQQFISNNDFDHATQLLNKLSSEYPAYAGIYNLRGIVAVREGNTRLAEDSFVKAVRLSPRFTPAYLNLGRLYQEASAADPEAEQKALNAYRHVLSYDTQNSEARYQSAFLLMHQGAYRQSLDQLAPMGAEAKRSGLVLSVTAADNAMLGFRKLTSEAVCLWTSQPSLAALDVQQALPYLARGKRFDLIIKLLERLQTQGPMPPDLLNSLGLAYEATARLKKSRAVFERVFAQSNSSAAPLQELAAVANLQRDYKSALGYLAHAQTIEPNNSNIDYSFGVDCLYLGLLAEAQKAFSKAVELAPDNPSYNYAMGITTSFMHDPNEGVPYLKQYADLRPKDPNGVLAVGTALFRAKDYEAASSWLTKASLIPQTSMQARYYLARIANRQRRTADAIAELGKILKVEPKDSDAWAELGQSYLLEKRYGKAEADLQRALSLDPDNYTANFNLLVVYTQMRDSRRDAQARRVQEVQRLNLAKTKSYLRVLDIRPNTSP
jgi:tetratricopeptide (TPR) repeat protein